MGTVISWLRGSRHQQRDPAALSRPAPELTWFCKQINVITNEKAGRGLAQSPYNGKDRTFLMSLLILILAQTELKQINKIDKKSEYGNIAASVVGSVKLPSYCRM